MTPSVKRPKQQWPAVELPLGGGGEPKGPLPYWAIVTKELWELRLTKAQLVILCYIGYRARKDSVCWAEIKTIGHETRTHPDYVRWVINFLVYRGLVVKTRRPGHTNYLELAPKAEWLAAHKGEKPGAQPEFEETKEEATEKVLWCRLWELIPGAPRALYRKRMKLDRRKVDRVLTELENRVRRGKMTGPDALPPVENPAAIFEILWREFK
jgi:DNA-binding MarR family transcriptional regulator